MSKLLYGSLCLSDLIEIAKTGHSAFKKSDNGKIYCSVNIWINDEKDQYGNDASIVVNPEKESGHLKKYIGNFKWSEIKGGSSPVSAKDIPAIDESDLPF
jgi:hypothetical protein